MKSAAGEGIDLSKNRSNVICMETVKKDRTVAEKNLLPRQFHTFILPNLQEFTVKADWLKTSDFEASGLEINCKYQDLSPQVAEPQQTKTEITIWDKLWLFVVEKSISAYFQIFVYCFLRYIP